MTLSRLAMELPKVPARVPAILPHDDLWVMKTFSTKQTRPQHFVYSSSSFCFFFQKAESASNILEALKKRKMQSMTSSGVDSLELLRLNLQYYFNEKVNVLMKEFVQSFFEPAIKNIKENTSEIINEQQVSHSFSFHF